MKMHASLENYRELLSKVDAKFDEISSRHPHAFACRKGCHSCCAPGLTISSVERASIHEYLSERPKLVEYLRELEKSNPHRNTRCSFLGEQGDCGVYEVRPLVCRSHGAPITFKNSRAERARDVCPLNFTDQSLDSLDSADCLDIDTVNTLLSLVNRQWETQAGVETQRFDLKLRAVLEASAIESGSEN